MRSTNRHLLTLTINFLTELVVTKTTAMTRMLMIRQNIEMYWLRSCVLNSELLGHPRHTVSYPATAVSSQCAAAFVYCPAVL